MTSSDAYIPIAVDAMGGDFAPGHVIAGALDALRETPREFTLTLVGREDQIRHELESHPEDAKKLADRYTIVHAPDVITMDDGPTAALKTKRESSIAVGLELHRQGKARAFVSAGNTGAMLSASTIILGRIKGVGRPTIGALVPTNRTPCLLVDAGANVDCRPRHLFEFGVMGSIYVSAMLGKPHPAVGLLNIGEETNKGNEVALEAFTLLKNSSLNFVGNVEGRDILKGGVDVVVCDGFVGNILLKFGESVPRFLKTRFTQFAEKSVKNKLVALVARGGLRSVLKELDYQEHGGVPLLGVNGVSIIGHGGSTPKAIKNMILRAHETAEQKIHLEIQKAISHYASEV